MAQTNNTFVEELQKLHKNIQPLKYMPGAEAHMEWIILGLEAMLTSKLQELHGVGGQFPGQQPGQGAGATGPTPDPMMAMAGGPPALGAGMGPGGPPMPPGMPPGMMGPGGPPGIPGPPPMPNAQLALPPTTPDMLANLRGGARQQ